MVQIGLNQGLTRRAWLALLPAGLAADTAIKRAKPIPQVGEFVAFADPTTETRVVRLTNPSSTSWLPAPANRFLSVRQRFLIFSSDRSGRAAPFRLDLHTGTAQQLAETSALRPESLWLDERERSIYLIEGNVLREITLVNRKARTVAEDVSAFALATGGRFAVVRKAKLELLNEQRVIAEEVAPFCLVRPGGNGCLFLREIAAKDREFWYARFTPEGDAKPVLLAKGAVTDPFWSPGGESLLFLREIQGRAGVFSEIHEVMADTGVEQGVAATSQFAAFAPNEDASVFVGASRSKAQPTIILLLRSARRELTLCEHRASNPGSVSPVFSPDSRRVYFQSDHQGKPALYSVNVELLVEPTAPTAA